MYQLVYSSKARPDIKSEEISSILESARHFNSNNQITGCLVYFDYQFIQFLEGDERIIRQLYDKIKIDDRHFDVVKIYSERFDNRVFSDWTMAYHELTDKDINYLKEEIFVDNLLNFSYLTEKPTSSVRLFWLYVNEILLIKDQTLK